MDRCAFSRTGITKVMFATAGFLSLIAAKIDAFQEPTALGGTPTGSKNIWPGVTSSQKGRRRTEKKKGRGQKKKGEDGITQR